MLESRRFRESHQTSTTLPNIQFQPDAVREDLENKAIRERKKESTTSSLPMEALVSGSVSITKNGERTKLMLIDFKTIKDHKPPPPVRELSLDPESSSSSSSLDAVRTIQQENPKSVSKKRKANRGKRKFQQRVDKKERHLSAISYFRPEALDSSSIDTYLPQTAKIVDRQQELTLKLKSILRDAPVSTLFLDCDDYGWPKVWQVKPELQSIKPNTLFLYHPLKVLVYPFILAFPLFKNYSPFSSHRQQEQQQQQDDGDDEKRVLDLFWCKDTLMFPTWIKTKNRNKSKTKTKTKTKRHKNKHKTTQSTTATTTHTENIVITQNSISDLPTPVKPPSEESVEEGEEQQQDSKIEEVGVAPEVIPKASSLWNESYFLVPFAYLRDKWNRISGVTEGEKYYSRLLTWFNAFLALAYDLTVQNLMQKRGTLEKGAKRTEEDREREQEKDKGEREEYEEGEEETKEILREKVEKAEKKRYHQRIQIERSLLDITLQPYSLDRIYLSKIPLNYVKILENPTLSSKQRHRPNLTKTNKCYRKALIIPVWRCSKTGLFQVAVFFENSHSNSYDPCTTEFPLSKCQGLVLPFFPCPQTDIWRTLPHFAQSIVENNVKSNGIDKDLHECPLFSMTIQPAEKQKACTEQLRWLARTVPNFAVKMVKFGHIIWGGGRTTLFGSLINSSFEQNSLTTYHTSLQEQKGGGTTSSEDWFILSFGVNFDRAWTALLKVSTSLDFKFGKEEKEKEKEKERKGGELVLHSDTTNVGDDNALATTIGGDISENLAGASLSLPFSDLDVVNSPLGALIGFTDYQKDDWDTNWDPTTTSLLNPENPNPKGFAEFFGETDLLLEEDTKLKIHQFLLDNFRNPEPTPPETAKLYSFPYDSSEVFWELLQDICEKKAKIHSTSATAIEQELIGLKRVKVEWEKEVKLRSSEQSYLLRRDDDRSKKKSKMKSGGKSSKQYQKKKKYKNKNKNKNKKQKGKNFKFIKEAVITDDDDEDEFNAEAKLNVNNNNNNKSKIDEILFQLKHNQELILTQVIKGKNPTFWNALNEIFERVYDEKQSLPSAFEFAPFKPDAEVDKKINMAWKTQGLKAGIQLRETISTPSTISSSSSSLSASFSSSSSLSSLDGLGESIKFTIGGGCAQDSKCRFSHLLGKLIAKFLIPDRRSLSFVYFESTMQQVDWIILSAVLCHHKVDLKRTSSNSWPIGTSYDVFCAINPCSSCVGFPLIKQTLKLAGTLLFLPILVKHQTGTAVSSIFTEVSNKLRDAFGKQTVWIWTPPSPPPSASPPPLLLPTQQEQQQHEDTRERAKQIVSSWCRAQYIVLPVDVDLDTKILRALREVHFWNVIVCDTQRSVASLNDQPSQHQTTTTTSSSSDSASSSSPSLSQREFEIPLAIGSLSSFLNYPISTSHVHWIWSPLNSFLSSFPLACSFNPKGESPLIFQLLHWLQFPSSFLQQIEERWQDFPDYFWSLFCKLVVQFSVFPAEWIKKEDWEQKLSLCVKSKTLMTSTDEDTAALARFWKSLSDHKTESDEQSSLLLPPPSPQETEEKGKEGESKLQQQQQQQQPQFLWNEHIILLESSETNQVFNLDDGFKVGDGQDLTSQTFPLVSTRTYTTVLNANILHLCKALSACYGTRMDCHFGELVKSTKVPDSMKSSFVSTFTMVLSESIIQGRSLPHPLPPLSSKLIRKTIQDLFNIYREKFQIGSRIPMKSVVNTGSSLMPADLKIQAARTHWDISGLSEGDAKNTATVVCSSCMMNPAQLAEMVRHRMIELNYTSKYNQSPEEMWPYFVDLLCRCPLCWFCLVSIGWDDVRESVPPPRESSPSSKDRWRQVPGDCLFCEQHLGNTYRRWNPTSGRALEISKPPLNFALTEISSPAPSSSSSSSSPSPSPSPSFSSLSSSLSSSSSTLSTWLCQLCWLKGSSAIGVPATRGELSNGTWACGHWYHGQCFRLKQKMMVDMDQGHKATKGSSNNSSSSKKAKSKLKFTVPSFWDTLNCPSCAALPSSCTTLLTPPLPMVGNSSKRRKATAEGKAPITRSHKPPQPVAQTNCYFYWQKLLVLKHLLQEIEVKTLLLTDFRCVVVVETEEEAFTISYLLQRHQSSQFKFSFPLVICASECYKLSTGMFDSKHSRGGESQETKNLTSSPEQFQFRFLHLIMPHSFKDVRHLRTLFDYTKNLVCASGNLMKVKVWWLRQEESLDEAWGYYFDNRLRKVREEKEKGEEWTWKPPETPTVRSIRTNGFRYSFARQSELNTLGAYVACVLDSRDIGTSTTTEVVKSDIPPENLETPPPSSLVKGPRLPFPCIFGKKIIPSTRPSLFTATTTTTTTITHSAPTTIEAISTSKQLSFAPALVKGTFWDGQEHKEDTSEWIYGFLKFDWLRYVVEYLEDMEKSENEQEQEEKSSSKERRGSDKRSSKNKKMKNNKNIINKPGEKGNKKNKQSRITLSGKSEEESSEDPSRTKRSDKRRHPEEEEDEEEKEEEKRITTTHCSCCACRHSRRKRKHKKDASASSSLKSIFRMMLAVSDDEDSTNEKGDDDDEDEKEEQDHAIKSNKKSTTMRYHQYPMFPRPQEHQQQHVYSRIPEFLPHYQQQQQRQQRPYFDRREDQDFYFPPRRYEQQLQQQREKEEERIIAQYHLSKKAKTKKDKITQGKYASRKKKKNQPKRPRKSKRKETAKIQKKIKEVPKTPPSSLLLRYGEDFDTNPPELPDSGDLLNSIHSSSSVSQVEFSDSLIV